MNKLFTSAGILLLWPLMAFLPVNSTTMPEPESLMSAPNQLSAAAKAAGWRLLFDGQSTQGWHSYNKDHAGSGWKIESRALVLDKSAGEEGGDLVTDGEFENYELRLEWKISDCGNSGIIFNVHEAPEYKSTYNTGPEMQVLDNACHPDAKIITHRAGDLYDMISCKQETVRPANQWNSVRLRVKNGKAQFWLNETKVVKFTMFNAEWEQMIANSKFKDMPGFGTFRKGHLALQDHGDKVWYRNITIKEL